MISRWIISILGVAFAISSLGFWWYYDKADELMAENLNLEMDKAELQLQLTVHEKTRTVTRYVEKAKDSDIDNLINHFNGL